MTQTDSVVSVERLTKRYGNRVAVDALTVDVPRGAVAGFIGPNGAGKTTTMAMLLGLVRSTSGDGTVLGESIHHPERYIARVGALLEGPALWPALTAAENLRVLAQLGGHSDRRIPDVLDLVGLGDRSDDRFGKYSLGMKQRLGIAAALLGDPDLLILDEPTNGLDPAGMMDMRDLITRISAEDRTVLLSSHLLSELEQICDWLVIIEQGRLVYAGRSDEFAAHTGTEVLLSPARAADLVILSAIIADEGLDAGRDGNQLIVPVGEHDPRQLAASLNSAAAAAGIVLAELHVRRPTLESNYLRLLEGDVA
ncbi:MAG: type transport system ATP-binding protein [Pseudonocardiales bacterium]|jgi:ABC-2 type transport system ATP-binding protein|nr:type transport system ATP-binding protein [Pseudonocardiales bacterium]